VVAVAAWSMPQKSSPPQILGLFVRIPPEILKSVCVSFVVSIPVWVAALRRAHLPSKRSYYLFMGLIISELFKAECDLVRELNPHFLMLTLICVIVFSLIIFIIL
jgi:hypothetical protein